jgi:hypothetical protein
MADQFKPDMDRAMKKFPDMRMTRAMAMDRITHIFKTDKTAAIKALNSLIAKGAESGGFNPAEKKAANKWYNSKSTGKVVIKPRGGGGTGPTRTLLKNLQDTVREDRKKF